MATPARPQPGIADSLTRRQLDELDELMQRMLALPVDPADETAGSPHPVAPAPSASDQGVDEGVPIAEQGSISPVAAQSPPIVARSPDHAKPPTEGLPNQETFGRPQWLGRGTKPQLKAEETESQLISYQQVNRRGPRSRADVPPAEWWLRPLLGCDRVFESGARWLGPFGRLLRGYWGRTALGFLGLSMLVGALTWLLAGRTGWIW
jgi:hypothetical protein